MPCSYKTLGCFVVKVNSNFILCNQRTFIGYGRLDVIEMIIVVLTFAIPACIIYYIVKLAIKYAIKEPKRDGTM